MDTLQGIGGQHPQAPFTACVEFSVSPEHITQAGPHDQFACRNAGNIVPAFTEENGVSSAIDDDGENARFVPLLDDAETPVVVMPSGRIFAPWTAGTHAA